MIIKLIGAILILLGCGGVGFSIASAHRKAVDSLEQLIVAVDYMHSELRYSLMSLPELCAHTADVTSGAVRTFFLSLADHLRAQISPHVRLCVDNAIFQCSIPEQTRINLQLLGDTLGCFDLEGQLSGLETVRERARTALELSKQNQDVRIRSYQTLGLCAGAAIVIIFI